MKNGLHLNASKTQTLYFTRNETDPLKLLGVTLDGRLNFSVHHANLLKEIRQRICVVRRLAAKIGRGSLLRAASQALVIGRIQCSAWVTREARLENSRGTRVSTEEQVALNDLARILTGTKRCEHVRTEDLIKKACIPTLNEIVVRQSAMAAWKAMRHDNAALRPLLVAFDGRTRSASEDLVKPSVDTIAARNIANAWNHSPGLRRATTLAAAKASAKNLGWLAKYY